MAKESDKAYVLITPARNEEAVIERTIQAVVQQRSRPARWAIVSDGSTDGTDRIVQSYADQHPFIHYVRLPEQEGRGFTRKAHAIRAGWERLSDIPYDFLGNLDADVTFSEDYYAEVLRQFGRNPELGIAGGVVLELIHGKYIRQKSSLTSVAGAVQLFRRKCYEDVGGYLPLTYGGVDAAAEIMARMNGWKVQAFPDLEVHHHNRVGARDRNIWRTRFRQGISHYVLGYHPLFQVCKGIYQATQRPVLLGSLVTLFGYFWSGLRGYEAQVPADVLKYCRAEQMERLRSLMPFNSRDAGSVANK